MAVKHPNPVVKGKSGYFGKAGKNNYIGPSGKHFDLAQVEMFYANKGKFPGQTDKSARAGWHAAGIHNATHGKSL